MSVAAIVSKLDMNRVREHFLLREAIHLEMNSLFDAGDTTNFTQLALGISNADANYSGSRHGLGPRVLLSSTVDDVLEYASELVSCASPHHLPDVIDRQKLPYLKISVGSEIAMLLRPNEFWVGNVRSIWTHLLLKHSGSIGAANEELSLYRDGESDSAMAYQIWRYIYLALEDRMAELIGLVSAAATKQHVPEGELKFLWADCVANELYEQFADKRK